ncbi:MAG: rod shape-determining protein [Lachnospiraceae bacterium]
MPKHTFYIDFGSDTMKIGEKDAGMVFVDKTAIAYQAGVPKIYGKEAWLYQAKTQQYQYCEPICGGVPANIDGLRDILFAAIHRYIRSYSFLQSNDFYVAVPAFLTQVEERAYITAMEEARIHANRIYFIPAAMANMANLPQEMRTNGSLILLDIGHEKTELSFIRDGMLIGGHRILTGGKTINERIMDNCKDAHFLLASQEDVVKLKMELGTAKLTVNRYVTVNGIDTQNRIPIERGIPSGSIVDAIETVLSGITDTIKNLLQDIPKEYKKEIMQNGIYLCGGTSMVSEIDEYFHDSLGMPVHIVEGGSMSVLHGMEKLLHEHTIQNYAISKKSPFYDVRG